MACDRGIREPEDIYGNGGGASYKTVTDGLYCPGCGCEMSLIEEHVGHWLNYCHGCGYTEER